MPELHRFFRPKIQETEEEQEELVKNPAHRFFKEKKSEQAPISSSIPKQAIKGAISGALGSYGDIAELLGIQKPSAPEVLPSQREKFYKEAKAKPEELVDIVEADELLPPYAKLPTTKDIGKYAKEFFGIREPESKSERIASRAGEAIGGAASLAAKPIGLLGAALGGITGQIAREAKTPELFATTVDLGTNLGTGLVRSLLSGKSAKNLASSLYETANKSLPEGAVGNAEHLEKSLSKLNKQMKLGTKAPSEKAIIDETEEILDKIKDGKLRYDEAVASKRSLNEKMLKLVYETPDKQAKGRARKLFGQIKSDLGNFLKTAEEKYPEFYKNQIAGDQAFATIAQSKKFADSIIDLAKSKYGPAALGGAIGLALNAGLMKPLLAVGVGLPALKAAEFTHRFLKSPVLRKHYNSLINSSLQDSKAGMINSLKKINKEMEEDPEIMELIK